MMSTARLPFASPGGAEVLHRGLDRAEVAEPHGGAVAVGDDHRSPLVGVEELVVGADRPRPGRIGELALRGVGVGGAERRAHLLEADAELAHQRGVELRAHGGARAAAHEHLADAVDLGELLRQDRVRGVVDAADRHGVRREREDHDGRVRRVDLPVGRIVRQVRRQLAARGIDRGLHVAGRRVDAPVQVELQHDRGGPEEARGGHLGHAGDAPELALQRRRHRRGHRLRARAGQGGLHLDDRELDLGQRRHRQQSIRDGPDQEQGDAQERRRDGPPDEGLGDAHVVTRQAPRVRARRRPPGPRATGEDAARAGRRRGRRRAWCTA